MEAVAFVGVVSAVGAMVVPVTAQGGLFDVFVRARENARGASCQNNLKQLMLGVMQYAMDYDERMPLATSAGKGTRSVTYSASYGWGDAIFPYTKSKQLFACPAERRPNAEEFSSQGFSDYWFNRAASGKKLSSFASPAQSLSLGDGDGGSAASTARYNIASLPPSWLKTPLSPALRHPILGTTSDSGANYAFLDGHVKRLRPSGLSTAPVAQARRAGAYATFSLR